MKIFQVFVGHKFDHNKSCHTSEAVHKAIFHYAKWYNLEGFTFVDGAGYWREVIEPSTIITLLSDTQFHTEVTLFAQALCQELKQEAVLVVSSPCQSYSVFLKLE